MNTRLLLAIAALLITNSHLEKFYPTPLLAGDGLVGNSIFFAVAGLGVTLSAKKRLRPFPHYYWRRIRRIYPTVIIVVTVAFVLIGRGWATWEWRDYVVNYVWPTPWAFIEYVMVLYIPLYALLWLGSARVFAVVFALCWVAFLWMWHAHPQNAARLSLGTLDPSIYWVFWFQMMLLGGYFGTATIRGGNFGITASVLAITFSAYVGLKAAFVTGKIASAHATMFVFAAAIVYLVLKLANSEAVNQWLNRQPQVQAISNWIGSRTLEIYVLQGFLAYRDDLARWLPCPLNIVLFCLLLSASAFIVNIIVTRSVPERGGRPAVA